MTPARMAMMTTAVQMTNTHVMARHSFLCKYPQNKSDEQLREGLAYAFVSMYLSCGPHNLFCLMQSLNSLLCKCFTVHHTELNLIYQVTCYVPDLVSVFN